MSWAVVKIHFGWSEFSFEIKFIIKMYVLSKTVQWYNEHSSISVPSNALRDEVKSMLCFTIPVCIIIMPTSEKPNNGIYNV